MAVTDSRRRELTTTEYVVHVEVRKSTREPAYEADTYDRSTPAYVTFSERTDTQLNMTVSKDTQRGALQAAIAVLTLQLPQSDRTSE